MEDPPLWALIFSFVKNCQTVNHSFYRAWFGLVWLWETILRERLVVETLLVDFLLHLPTYPPTHVYKKAKKQNCGCWVGSSLEKKRWVGAIVVAAFISSLFYIPTGLFVFYFYSESRWNYLSVQNISPVIDDNDDETKAAATIAPTHLFFSSELPTQQPQFCLL